MLKPIIGAMLCAAAAFPAVAGETPAPHHGGQRMAPIASASAAVDTGDMPGMDMPAMGMPGASAMSGMGSGTSRLPAAETMSGLHVIAGGGQLMVHGYAWASYTEQGGPRGDDELFGPVDGDARGPPAAQRWRALCNCAR